MGVDVGFSFSFSFFLPCSRARGLEGCRRFSPALTLLARKCERARLFTFSRMFKIKDTERMNRTYKVTASQQKSDGTL